MSKCILGIEQSCDECRMCQQEKERLMYYDKFTKAIIKHMENNRKSIRNIRDCIGECMMEEPSADEEILKESIFVLAAANKALGLIAALKPNILYKEVDTYGGAVLTDAAIEEMSELTKALLKFPENIEDSPEGWFDFEKRREGIYEEIADVIIMLVQLIMIYDGGFCEAEFCEIIRKKVEELEQKQNTREDC